MKNLLNFVAVQLLVFGISSNLFSDIDEQNRVKSEFFGPGVESLNISDWKNPTFEDYTLIQDHLRSTLIHALDTPTSSRCFGNERLNRDLHGWITYRFGRLQMVDSKYNMPSYHVVHFNNDPEKKDKCIICYAAYPKAGAETRDYRRGINFMIESLKIFNFDGHFIYRIGGWPNLKNDRLKFADVPYAFKPFFFEEVRDLGYKKILWLDSAVLPVRSVAPIFDFIEKNGCCFFANEQVFERQEIEDMGYVFDSLNLPREKEYKNLLAQVVGFNLHDDKASRLLNRWIEAAEQKVPFVQSAPDQICLSLLVSDMGLFKGRLPDEYSAIPAGILKSGNFIENSK